jgi:hypothetical protein
MLRRMDYYRIWLSVPLVLPVLYFGGLALAQGAEREQQSLIYVAIFFIFGWLPYACTAIGYYFRSCRTTPYEMRAALMYAPLRMLGWVAGVFALSCFASPFLLIGLPFAAIATLAVGYAFVGIALGLEEFLRWCGVLRADA